MEKHGVLKDVLEDDYYYEIKPDNLIPFIKDLEDSGYEVRPAGDLEFDP